MFSRVSAKQHPPRQPSSLFLSECSMGALDTLEFLEATHLPQRCESLDAPTRRSCSLQEKEQSSAFLSTYDLISSALSAFLALQCTNTRFQGLSVAYRSRQPRRDSRDLLKQQCSPCLNMKALSLPGTATSESVRVMPFVGTVTRVTETTVTPS